MCVCVASVFTCSLLYSRVGCVQLLICGNFVNRGGLFVDMDVILIVCCLLDV